uniref:Uncharacterized protein n=1 Tax=Anguilla anguilla TaxID=7936 RepID=A0A0E9PZ49_ANGAN
MSPDSCLLLFMLNRCIALYAKPLHCSLC